MSREHRAVPEILDERTEFTLREFCEVCGVSAECVIEMVGEALLEPRGRRPGEWRFSGHAVLRARSALRLQRDLRVNLPGTALVLDLLEELETHRRRARHPGWR